MTVLTRIEVDPANPAVQRDLGDLGDMHRRTMSAFPTVDHGQARRALGLLWRLDWSPDVRRLLLLVQSSEAGEWDSLPPGWARSVATKSIDPAIEGLRVGQALRFRLRANATRKIDTKTLEDGGRRHGRRVPLRADDRALTWLSRHAEMAGFTVGGTTDRPSVYVRHEPAAFVRRAGGVVTIEAIRYDGCLIVTEPRRLVEAVRTGMGPAKAFGCGLLSLASGAPV